MQPLLILLSGFMATTVMTSFSYFMARLRSNQFREPRLLNILITRSTSIPFKPNERHITGWIIHYSIGCFFVSIFHLVWYVSDFSVSVFSGAALGFIAGIIGISGWKTFFYLNADPPHIRFKRFYFQLLFAHILFGITAAGTFLVF